MNYILIFLSGLISGMIIFQSALVAPTIFKVIPENQAGPFLRSIFPKLFLTIALMTNRARDKGNSSLFNRLHFVSVALTLIVLLGNISLIMFI